MHRIGLIALLFMMALPIFAQDEVVIEPIPNCTAEELILIPDLMLDSGFLLDYALIEMSASIEGQAIDYLPTITAMMAVRDVWIEAIEPNMPECAEAVQARTSMRTFLDQSLIQMMSSTISTQVDESYADRADLEMARLQSIELELGFIFESLFADVDIEARLIEQMEAREAND